MRETMKTSFEQLEVRPALIAGLAKAGITVPTQIQAAVIPDALKGLDVIGQSATGTGKTLAYLLPLFQKVDTSKREMQAIVLAPTHELAMQIFRQAELLAQNSGEPVTAAVIIGEVNIARQIDKLKEKPHLIIGSAGRILELIQKRKINAQTIKTLVVDEADRLLDDSNRAAVASVIKSTQKDRQLMLFSATITPAAVENAAEWMQDPVFSTVQADSVVPLEIDHVFIMADARDKIDTLRKILASLQTERTLVFVNTANSIAEVVAKLCHHGVAAVGIHGSSMKGDRQAAMEDFRTGRARVMVASDLAARGLDIPGVENVVNLDLPEDPQSYLHRAGRTGRAGEFGSVISVVDRTEARHINFLQKSLQIRIPEKLLSYGKLVDPAKPVRRETLKKSK